MFVALIPKKLHLFLTTTTWLAHNFTCWIQALYSPHHWSTGVFKISNAISTCCLHFWQEETFVQHVRNKNLSSCNIRFIGDHALDVKPKLVHSKILCLILPFVGWDNGSLNLLANMNILIISTVHGVGRNREGKMHVTNC
jgi:hypothetical protein